MSFSESLSVTVRGEATDGGGSLVGGIVGVELRARGQVVDSQTNPATSPRPFTLNWGPAVAPRPCQGPVTLTVVAKNDCGATASASVSVTLTNRGTVPACSPNASEPARLSDRGTLESSLDLENGEGQVVMNGAESAFTRRAPSRLAASLFPRNRVEATLVAGRGAGTWAFRLPEGARPGSLRVVAGEVVAVGPAAVTFRLRGRPGERVVFTFAAR
jgi:hypothetical protein